jgi:hypothetical protein
MSIREGFVARFGEADAAAIEAAAREHSNGINSTRTGSDPFRWAIAIAIGYQCMELGRYRAHHGIVTPWTDLKAWIIEHGNLKDHDGDVDYLSMFIGTYNEYVGKGASQ